MFDEFSICERPSGYYSWGEKNMTPKFKTDERKRERLNGFLGIDLLSADFFFQSKEVAKAEDVASYFADLAKIYEEKGVKKLIVFFDGNPTHKVKMQDFVLTKIQDLKLSIVIDFRFIAAYSPKLNLVEYAIHNIRQKVLHHANCKKDLKKFEREIKELCDDNKIFNIQNIENILNHIDKIVGNL